MTPPSRSKRPSQSRWSRLHLIMFNAIMVAAWAVFLWNLAKEMVWGTGKVKPSTVLRNYAWDLVCVQSVEIMESVHSLLGIVPSGLTSNMMLWAGRMIAAFFGGMTLATSINTKLDNTVSYAFVVTAAAWSIADILRFLCHLESLLVQRGNKVSLIKWLRYTVFIVLFPIGMVSELVLINAARLYKVSQGSFRWNPVVIGYMGVASVGFMYIYLHMFQQRRRHLAR